MKIENQVTSLELSKKLKELGVKQESAFYWYFSIDDNKWKITDNELLKDERWEWCFAFTVAELGEMLPKHCKSFQAYNTKKNNKWWCEYSQYGVIDTKYAETEANARAKMLIYLLENNLIKQ